jgi:acyl-coenzyme A synthetase/AMP-(fatty) acid ligase/acyl carrier protein
LQLVPSLLRVLLDEPEFGGCRSLKRVISAGESLPVELHDRFTATMGAELHNFYGPTEAAIDVTFWRCGRSISRPVAPIGHPLANTQIYILEADLQSMPVGMPGELQIGGANLARGYLNRPELTAERFIPHPFGEEPGARLYRTGDLARRLPDGAVEYLGRIDHQVKVRGFRIELGEIEAALNQHPAIQESVVLAREDRPGARRLAAYVVPKWGLKQEKARANNGPPLFEEEGGRVIDTGMQTELSNESLRVYLQQKLPAYSVPSSFVILESLPLLPNGKVARQALPAPGKYEAEFSDGYVAPSTPIEKDVARIFSEALGIDNIGVYDDFFVLGGHSLLVIQVINRVNKAFQINLPIRALFDGPTVSSLVNLIVENQAGQLEDDVLSRVLAEMWVASGNE